ncbi:Unc5C-Like Protein [Manis pentadactyla]|nr:Unc5C-Like Protein [Manis pentadactyla]
MKKASMQREEEEQRGSICRLPSLKTLLERSSCDRGPARSLKNRISATRPYLLLNSLLSPSRLGFSW